MSKLILLPVRPRRLRRGFLALAALFILAGTGVGYAAESQALMSVPPSIGHAAGLAVR